MKFLHLSDLHLGKVVRGFSMLEDQRYLLSQVVQAASDHQVDAVIIAGDVYDKHFPPEEAVQPVKVGSSTCMPEPMMPTKARTIMP